MDQYKQQPASPEERRFGVADTAPRDAPASNERRGRAAWRSPRLVTLLMMSLLVLLVVCLSYLRDESLPWDEDLRRPIFVQQDRDVSAPARMKMMLTAAGKLSARDGSAPSVWTEDASKLGAMLDAHQNVLANFTDLLGESQNEWEPRSLLWKLENMAADPAWSGVIVLKEAECAYLAGTGHEEPAFRSACHLLELGCQMEKLDAWPSFMDRALELQEHGTRLLARLLARTGLPEAVLRRLQNDEFNKWAPDVKRLNAAMSGYYLFERKLLLGPDGDEPPLPLWYLPARSGWRIFFKPNATLRLFAESFRELKNESGRSAFSRGNQIESRLFSRMISESANRSGEDYFATRIRTYTALLDRYCEARTRHSMVLTLFAIRRSVAHDQRLPAKLDDLVPKYLDTLPADSFSGEPVRYDPKRGLIWSVGMDFKDEGGRPTLVPMSDPDEPTVEIGISMARAGS